MPRGTESKKPTSGPSKKPLQEGEIDPWALAGLGLQLGITLVVGVYGGQWIDNRLGSAPWGMLVGAFLLGGGTFVVSYRRLMAKSRQSREQGRSDD